MQTSSDLMTVLSRLDAWYLQHVPTVHATLRPGLTDPELDAFEIGNELHLPSAFRALYRWHDGQDWSVGGVSRLEFPSMHQVAQARQLWRDIADGECADMNVTIYTVAHPTGAIRKQYAQRDLLPFLSDRGGNHVALDFAPDLRGQAGQVITTGRDETHRYVLAPDLDVFLSRYLNRLERGRVTVERLSGYSPTFWSVRLHDQLGRREDSYHRLADLYPGFGAAPEVVSSSAWQEDEPLPLESALGCLDAWLAQHHPDLLAQLGPGATVNELQAAESRLGRGLPAEVKVLYQRHRTWGHLFGAENISVDELGQADPHGFGPPDAPATVVPFTPFAPETTARDWVPLWVWGQGFIGIDLARHGEIRTFGLSAQPRYVLAESLTRLFDRYVRLLEAGVLRRFGQTLRLPDAEGKDEGDRIEGLFPGFGALPAVW